MVGALIGLAELGYGLYQQSQNKRPDYKIPSEIGQNLSQANQMALQGLPESVKRDYINNLQRSQAYGLSQIGSRKGGLQGVAEANQQAVDAYGELMSVDAKAKLENQRALLGQRTQMADYKQQAFQINELNPYYEKRAEANANMGAGIQNIGNNMNSLEGSVKGKAPVYGTNANASTPNPYGQMPMQNTGAGYDPTATNVDNQSDLSETTGIAPDDETNYRDDFNKAKESGLVKDWTFDQYVNYMKRGVDR